MSERILSIEELQKLLIRYREGLEPAFATDTAAKGTVSSIPSAGHCAAVAAILHKRIGGRLVSATVQGISHWFNRFDIAGRVVDADITGDQFGLSPIRVTPIGELFPGTRERRQEELNDETRNRADLLEQRAQLKS